jgi:hypothetical protein
MNIMNKKLIYILIFFSSSCFGQINYVPNPSFEAYDTCPYSAFGGIDFALPWFQPCTQNSSDYFNICATDPDWDIPYNFAGYQVARTGNAYSGIVLRHAGGLSEGRILEE